MKGFISGIRTATVLSREGGSVGNLSPGNHYAVGRSILRFVERSQRTDKGLTSSAAATIEKSVNDRDAPGRLSYGFKRPVHRIINGHLSHTPRRGCITIREPDKSRRSN